ncbi:CLUMA_CG011664, isoform A [Clunio marinus]|uniref:CLUMA_CG011664, isoform A n=1 Tax=Clunio marinus TaxID=568069 RepID=A0A1J1IGY8_9DIPT|nr:CLUMA_CG011664, isoform A [Clunio marinus]
MNFDISGSTNQYVRKARFNKEKGEIDVKTKIVSQDIILFCWNRFNKGINFNCLDIQKYAEQSG